MSDFYTLFHPEVDKALNIKLEHKVGERVLGNDPKTGKPVSVKIGRFGPLVQIGQGDGDDKPLFASLLKGQSVSTITLDEALKLFDFPRTLGTYEDHDVVVGIGRFGPYVRHNGKFISIPKETPPASLTLAEAIELINDKRNEEHRRVVKTFDNDPDLMILNGRYGVYIAYKKTNYRMPKTITDPASLDYDAVMEIVNSQEAAPKKTTRRTSAKKKA